MFANLVSVQVSLALMLQGRPDLGTSYVKAPGVWEVKTFVGQSHAYIGRPDLGMSYMKAPGVLEVRQ